MQSHEGISRNTVPDLTVEGEIYNELQRDKELDEISDSLAQMAKKAELGDGERVVEKSWVEEMAEVGEFDKKKAEEAIENDKPTAETHETDSTSKYEAEIRALDKYADNADFLNAPVPIPTRADLVRAWAKDCSREVKSWYVDSSLIRSWVWMKDLSREEKTLRKSLLKSGVLKKDRFYKPSKNEETGLEERWKNAEESYRFTIRDDQIKTFIKTELQKYDTMLEEVQTYGYEANKESMSRKAELVHKWLEEDRKGSQEQANLIIDWLDSDDGSEGEKRYRALARVKLSGIGFVMLFPDRLCDGGCLGQERDSPDTIIAINKSPRLNFRLNKEFENTLMKRNQSEEFAELSEEEKNAKWEEAFKLEEEKEARLAAERLEKERKIASQVRAERKLTSAEEERMRVEAEAEKARKKAEEERRRKEEEEQQARLAAESTMDSSADSMDLWNNIMGQMSA